MFVPLALLVSCILLVASAGVQRILSGPVEDKYSCPHGWTRYGSKKCLKYVNELQDYERAQATCRSKNQGQLVTIHSLEEQNFVYTYIHSIAASSTPIWLGAKQSTANEKHAAHQQIDFESILWLDKTENSYTNWAQSEPSHPDEICIAINPRNGQWHDVMCTEANVPACERAPTTQWPFFVAFCSEGWFQFNDEKCVRIISSQALNFYESQELCRSKYNSKLLSIKSDKESEFVHNLIKFRDLKLPVWLGAVQNDFSSFNWIDRSDVTFTNWAESEPNDPDHACISMTASGGKWADNDCKEQKLILCQKAVPEDGSCETGWLQFRQDQCYRFVHIRLTFDDAETLCNNLYGGHLPSIHSQEEQFMITQFLTSVNVKNGSEIWLGARQMDFHNFNWADGSMFNYSHWDHNEPNFPAEKCIEMSWRNGRWNDIQCRLKRAVLCERHVTSRHPNLKPDLYQSKTCLDGLAASNCSTQTVGSLMTVSPGNNPTNQSAPVVFHSDSAESIDALNRTNPVVANETASGAADPLAPQSNLSTSSSDMDEELSSSSIHKNKNSSAIAPIMDHHHHHHLIDDRPIKVIASIRHRDPQAQAQQHLASSLQPEQPTVLISGVNSTSSNTTDDGPQVGQQQTHFTSTDNNSTSRGSSGVVVLDTTTNGFLTGKKDSTAIQDEEQQQERLNLHPTTTSGGDEESLLDKLRKANNSNNSTTAAAEQSSAPVAAPQLTNTTATSSHSILEKPNLQQQQETATKEPTSNSSSTATTAS